MFSNYVRKSFAWQFHWKLNPLPWHDMEVQTQEDMIFQYHYAGWLFFQLKWITFK